MPTTTSALFQQLEPRTMLAAIVIAGSDGDDVIHARQITDDVAGPRLDVWINADPQQAPPTDQFPLDAANSLRIDARDGNDTILLNLPASIRRVTLLGGQGNDALDAAAQVWDGELIYDAGDGDDAMVLREAIDFSGWLIFDGGAGTDSFQLIGTRDYHRLVLGTRSNDRRGGIDRSGYRHLNVENELYELRGDHNNVSVHGDYGRRRIEPGDAANEIRIRPDQTQTTITLRINGRDDAYNSLFLFDGDFVASADLGLLAPRLQVDVNGHTSTLQLHTSQSLRELRVTSAASVVLAPGGDKVLSLLTLKIDEQSRLDLTDNELQSRQPSIADLEASIARARNTGPTPWAGPGITSSSAAQNPLTGLAVALRGSIAVTRLAPNGDINLDGKITADDYFAIDSAWLSQPPGPLYAHGDFNYDGTINFDDYFLIDSAFLAQGSPLAVRGDASPLRSTREPRLRSPSRHSPLFATRPIPRRPPAHRANNRHASGDADHRPLLADPQTCPPLLTTDHRLPPTPPRPRGSA